MTVSCACKDFAVAESKLHDDRLALEEPSGGSSHTPESGSEENGRDHDCSPPSTSLAEQTDGGGPPISLDKNSHCGPPVKSSKTKAGPAKKVPRLPTKPKIRGSPKPKSSKKPAVVSHKITEYYHVRRSSRTPAGLKKQESVDELKNKLLSLCQDGLEVCHFDEKGRGVIATKEFKRGEFVVEYKGDLVSRKLGRKREAEYSNDPEIGSYIYFFEHRNRLYCVDATAETAYLGRLVNHSRLNPNCRTRSVDIDGRPYLYLEAIRDIPVGDEITYDYGDKNKESLELHPWLANS